MLVVTRNNERQKDVEVVRAVVGETGSDVGQRTSHAVDRENENLDKDNADQRERRTKIPKPREERNPNDADHEKQPHDGVKELDRTEFLIRVHGEFSYVSAMVFEPVSDPFSEFSFVETSVGQFH